jgi:hypothetical protein
MTDTPTPARPTLTPDLVSRFAAYKAKHPAWGSLHIVLDDGNYLDDHVRFCIGWAKAEGDREGAALAEVLLALTKSQRSRLDRKVEEANSAALGGGSS